MNGPRPAGAELLLSDVILRTERLVLREFAEHDWPAVLAYQRDPRYLRFYPADDRTEADAREFVERFLDWRRELPRLRFGLAVTLKGEVIGNAGVRRSANEPSVADIGYELSPSHWGRGFATEAARAVLDLGFRSLGLHRVTAHCIADNLASVNVLRRLGMREEGRFREHESFKGRWWDVLHFGMLRREWEAGGPGPVP